MLEFLDYKAPITVYKTIQIIGIIAQLLLVTYGIIYCIRHKL